MRRKSAWAIVVLLGSAAAFLAAVGLAPRARALAAQESTNPADWGSDHVGEPVPEYASGTECLFCHRDYVGPRWPSNPHNRTMRTADADDPAMKTLADAKVAGLAASDVEVLLGADDNARYLRKLPEYGKLEIHGAKWRRDQENGAARDRVIEGDHPGWDEKLFADKCAGCHATGVDPEMATISTSSLECFVCHGLTEIEHTAKEIHAVASGKGPGDARVETSVCAQCHLRGGVSKATGRPYPTNFVPGDNLLRDFQVDLSDKRVDAAEPYERHILASARDVLLRGMNEHSCMACHQIHENSTKKHQELAEKEYCAICHRPGRPLSEVDIPRPKSNGTCQY